MTAAPGALVFSLTPADAMTLPDAQASGTEPNGGAFSPLTFEELGTETAAGVKT